VAVAVRDPDLFDPVWVDDDDLSAGWHLYLASTEIFDCECDGR